MFRPDTISKMRAHAAACYPEESCGLVLWDDYVPRPNVHPDPRRHFRMAPGVLTGAKVKIQALVHSHPAPAAPPYPSYRDMAQQIAMDVPWVIVPVAESGAAGEPFVWGDGSRVPALLGRGYRWGVTDCYSVIRDWYRLTCGVALPAVAREWGYWQADGAVDLYLAHCEAAGFTTVAPAAAEVGDVALYTLPGMHAAHHASVVISPGKILHHPARKPFDPARLSLTEPLARYQQYVTHVLRPTDRVPRA